MNKKHSGLHPAMLRLSLIAAALVFAPSIAMAANLFVSSAGSNSIYEFTSAGNQSTFASGLNAPQGLAFDAYGNLFEADGALGSGSTINKITPTGSRSTFATASQAIGLAFDGYGDLFEVDSNSGTIYKFTPAGSRSIFASGLIFPVALAFDATGNLFATDASTSAPGSGSIYKFTPAGSRSTFVSGLTEPWGLAFDANGNLFETETFAGIIYEFTPAGNRSTFATGLSNPDGLAFDASGNLFEADFNSSHIYEFTPTGIRSTFTGAVFEPTFLAFATVPEPSSIILLVVGGLAVSSTMSIRRTMKRCADHSAIFILTGGHSDAPP
jgi:sugar lactone lactonase YvrE